MAMRRLLAHVLAFAAFVLAGLVSVAALAAPGRYVHIHVDGVINPIEERYIERAIARATAERAEFLLISIDTPGGLVASLQNITTAITNAPLPVVGFVEPQSAQATSAGAFILLATDVAAMAPGTRVGAAHPVAAGKPLEGALDAKATNSLSSLAKSLAARRGRPAAPAEAMVRESKSFTETEAQAAGLIEIRAVNRAHLLNELHGRKLTVHGKERVLATRGLAAIDLPLSRSERLLDKLADPTLASLLLSLGVLAILYELSSPGVGMGGVVGAVSLLLALLALSVLPLELGGVVLIGVGLAAVGLEVKVPSHGLLAGGGVIALLLGTLLLVDPSEYFGGVQRASVAIVAPVVVSVVLGVLLLARVTRRALRAPYRTGPGALVGKHGVAKTAFTAAGGGYSGSVLVDGARWQGTAKTAIADGERIVVTEVLRDPMRLAVARALEPEARPAQS
jgi:membrane-bound serine protease (ClpP class)